MRSSWRRSILISLIIAAAMIAVLAGTVWAAITGVTITAPSQQTHTAGTFAVAIPDVTVSRSWTGWPTYAYTPSEVDLRCGLSSTQGGSVVYWSEYITNLSPSGSSHSFGSETFTFLGPVSDGKYHVRVQARPAGGGTGVASTASSSPVVWVDTTLPVISGWKFGTDDADGAIIETRNSTLTVSITDATSGFNSATWAVASVSVSRGSVGTVVWPSDPQGGTASIPLEGLESGDHTVILGVVDRAGHWAFSGIVFTVDTRPTGVAITGTPTATYPNWSKSDVPLRVYFDYMSDPDLPGWTSATVELWIMSRLM